MTVRELSPEQYKELCQDYITRFWVDNEHGTSEPSWYDLAYADEMVAEAVIYKYYDGVEFTDEDFTCSKEV